MPTPYERVKAAWDTPDRRVPLHRAVETMAAEGVTRDALDAALDQLLMEVRATGADDDTEEIIMEVGDRLHGWCAPSGHIRTVDGLPFQPATPPQANGHPALPVRPAPPV